MKGLLFQRIINLKNFFHKYYPFVFIILCTCILFHAAIVFCTTDGIIPSQEFTTSRPVISLDGEWEFSYDPNKIGEKEKWFTGDVKLPEKTKVPGCNQAEQHLSAGTYDGQVGEFMMDIKYPETSPGWHKKVFRIPAEWKGKNIWLHVGGVKPAAEIWCNGMRIGETVTSRSPVRCNLTQYLKFDADNILVIKVFWPPFPKPRLDGVMDWFAAWSGIYRSIWIEAVLEVSIEGINVQSKINPATAKINFNLAGTIANKKELRIRCEIKGLNDNIFLSQEKVIDANTAFGEHSVEFDMSGALLWSPENPNLYEATVNISEGIELIDRASIRFGLREIKTQGDKILLNGRPVFLSGGSDIHVYPETVCPPASKEFFVQRIKKQKCYGFNYTKSCVDIYTKEYLDAADEVGLLVCQEVPFGVVGDYRIKIRENAIPDFMDLWRRELVNMISFDRNHPCIIIYSMSSEMSIEGITDASFRMFCKELPTLAKQLNSSALVVDITHGGGWGINSRRGQRVTDLVENTAGLQYYQEPLSHPLEGEWQDLTLPYLVHEYNWWTSLPDPVNKPRYGNIPYKFKGPPEMEKEAQKRGYFDQLPTFVRNSRKLKYVLQKSGLELTRRHRHPQVAGYHFWLIQSLPWCPEGLFNEFWEEPDDLTAEECRTYNYDTVLLLDDNNRRCFECGEQTSLGIEISHFGSHRLTEPILKWQLITGGKPVLEDSRKLEPIECGELTPPCGMMLKMPEGFDPVQYELLVELFDGYKKIGYNHWNLWTYPRPKGGEWVKCITTDLSFLTTAYPGVKKLEQNSLDSANVVVANKMDTKLIDFLMNGGRVVLFSDSVLKEYRAGVEIAPGDTLPNTWDISFAKCYRSVPWNMGRHGNMGTVMKHHPALGTVPHDGWCDLNFVHLISGIYPMSLEFFTTPRVDPIIRSIGHHLTMVDKAYMFEVKVGKGALLATSLKIIPTYDSRHPETRYLVESMLRYAAGGEFNPKTEITGEQLRWASNLKKNYRVALIQFDAVPEQNERNVREMERLARAAASQSAEIIMFHESSVTDYVGDMEKYSEYVPDGPSCKKMEALARELKTYISFGLSEKTKDGYYYITYVFMGPEGFVYKYRKTWIWREPSDEGFRNEWARYDCGPGPEIFKLGGLRATCFICADGEAPRCIERAALLKPEIVFYPNNRGGGHLVDGNPTFRDRAARIKAPMLVTNRVGKSWKYECKGGCAVISSNGTILSKTDPAGREEILIYDLEL